MSTTCRWWLDGDTDVTAYETCCGNMFEFYDGGPTDNKFAFCPYCGARLQDDGVITSEEEQ